MCLFGNPGLLIFLSWWKLVVRNILITANHMQGDICALWVLPGSVINEKKKKLIFVFFLYPVVIFQEAQWCVNCCL